MDIKMKPNESVAAFTARLEKLRRDAKAPDNLVMVNRYRRALLPELAERVATARAGLPASAKCTVQQTSALAISLEFHNRDQGSNASSRDRSRSPSSDSASEKQGKKRRVTENRSKTCALHGKASHTTSECRKMASMV